MRRTAYVLVALATTGWALPAASQGHGAAPNAARAFPDARASPSAAVWARSAAALPQALRPSTPSTELPGEHRRPIRLDRYTYWGMGIGGAGGLAYGLVEGDDTFGLSPVIEMVIGAGIGFYVGAAADIVRSLRPPRAR